MLAASLIVSVVAFGQAVYKPSETELAAAYKRADGWVESVASRTFLMQVAPVWLDGGKRFWYRADRRNGAREFIVVDSSTGAKSAAFDHTRLMQAWLAQEANAKRLPFNTFEYQETGDVYFEANGSGWIFDPKTGELKKVAARERRQQQPGPWRQDINPPESRERTSPDGEWIVQIKDWNVVLRKSGGEEKKLTTDGTPASYYARTSWSPDSKHVVVTRVTAGDRKEVHLIESSPRGGGRAQLQSRIYDLPGDKLDVFDHYIVNVADGSVARTKADTVDYWSLPMIRWQGSKFMYEKLDRGYGRWRLMEVDATNGEARALIDDDPATFYDITSHWIHYNSKASEAIFRSERDGFGHLYRVDLQTGAVKSQITSGPWVIRSVPWVDEGGRQLVLMGSGREAGQDPYYTHAYKVNFDGSGFTRLTDGDGYHEITLSPDRSVFVDTWSRVDKAPVHELRRVSDGSLIAKLEEADMGRLSEIGYKAPERFVAKGRDGKTDIYGILIRPSNFDPRKKYPIVEDIYAGPQDSFVPKSLRGFFSNQALAELGFMVVRIDGMGTRNRGKAFHDVAWKNIADAGLPDRILWMKALASKYPYLDTSRVGVYGTSAGGQNSTGAVLFHPEFYKVAVSSCGCHDNRMDKVWWNEQWMGLIGPHYAEQSNITNARKLKGNLLLMVGELDDNVPPESTFRLADALIDANKEFELLVLPGARHTGGGAYGERKRRDFFVRHLHGVKTPVWNR